MLSEGWRAVPYIHRNVPYRSAHDTDELALRVWRRLEMQAADDASIAGQGMVVLHERGIDAMPGKQAGIEDFGEKPALIAMFPGLDELDLRYFQAADMHEVI